MFGGSSKVGRGGGRGGAGGGSKRFPAPPLQPTRPALPSAGRLSLSGGPRNRNTGPAAAAPPSVEETFSLVSGNNPLAFAMIIRLTPDLVEEIRRVEAQGETAKIKFDANPKNPSGNECDANCVPLIVPAQGCVPLVLLSIHSTEKLASSILMLLKRANGATTLG
ncbi:hypothetical protein CRG98_036068 [Punica granatum]|uniref:Uncharacterized protein n=1 Tax=Punica granatum TaxID=22663 RepID=A0A2I0IID9_PUNGR|nr:hypothetical protein CRG98_036068 [Punica granatum]